MRKRFCIFGMAAMLCLVLVGSGYSASATQPSRNENWPRAVQIATASSLGANYAIGGGFATLIQRHLGIPTSAQSTQGPVENIRLIESDAALFAFFKTSDAMHVIRGEEAFADKKYTDFRAILSNPPLELMIIVNADKGIKTAQDLKGKTISIGAAGSSGPQIAAVVFDILGIGDNDVRKLMLSQADAFSGMQDGNVDAMFYFSTSPNSSVTEAMTGRNIKILSLDNDLIAKILEKRPDMFPFTITQDKYPGMTEGVSTIAEASFIVAKSGLDNDFVYAVTKTILENIAEVHAAHALLKSVSVERALDGLPIPLHEGARRYYEEIGHQDLANVPTEMPQ